LLYADYTFVLVLVLGLNKDWLFAAKI